MNGEERGRWERLEAGEWVRADEFMTQASTLMIFSLIARGQVQYRRRWFKRGKWLRRVK